MHCLLARLRPPTSLLGVHFPALPLGDMVFLVLCRHLSGRKMSSAAGRPSYVDNHSERPQNGFRDSNGVLLSLHGTV